MDPRNLSRRVAVVLAQTLGPTVLVVPDGDDRAVPAATAQWVRLQADDVDAVPAGQLDGERAEVRRVLITADCYTRGAALQAAPNAPQPVDDVDGLAYAVARPLSSSMMLLPDYVADPTGATLTGRVIQFTTPALRRRLDPIDGIQRRQVLATATVLSQV